MKIEKKNSFTLSDLSEKEKRNLEILALVAKKGLISRTELSRETGINIVSISNYIKNHIEKKLVFDAGQDVSTGGRKPELVEINNEDNCVIGIEAKAGSARLVLTDLASKKKGCVAIDCSNLKDKDIAPAVAATAKKLLSESSIPSSSLRAIGLGVEGPLAARMAKELEALTGASVYAGEWASCAAYGEFHLNRSVETDRLLYMHSDLGKGVVIIKDAFIGSEGDAKNSEDNSSSYLRPWDKILGLVENARREVTRGIGTDIVKLSGANAENITESVVISAAKQKDEVASIILQNVSINLGLRIAYLINLFSPKAVVIGGGIETAGDIVFTTIKKMVNKLAFARQAKAVSIIPGTLGQDGISLGAASMAVREVFINA